VVAVGLGVGCGPAGDPAGEAHPGAAAVEPATPASAPLLERELDGRLAAPTVPAVSEEERLRVGEALRRFYRQRGFRPAWSEDGIVTDQARDAVERLGEAPSDGFDPAFYGADALRERIGRLDDWHQRSGTSATRRRRMVELDVDLSAAVATYALNVRRGRVDPRDLGLEWYVERPSCDLAEVLDRSRTEGFAGVVAELQPDHDGFEKLREALPAYLGAAATGSWGEVPSGRVLEPGDAAPADRIQALSDRLGREGYLEPGAGVEGLYTRRIADAVTRFQRNHGLEADGVLGPATLEQLNVPAAERVRAIVLNLERWRWLPDDLGATHVEVNLASFMLEVVEAGRTTMRMRVIAGRPEWMTPVFSDRIQTIVVNPTWHVPRSIAAEEILPKAIEDPGHLRRENLVIAEGWQEDAEVIDPAAIEWEAVDPESFPYRLRRGPGAGNPLGRIKFLFPNQHKIYLHDTPAGGLFEAVDRSLSHGCVRLRRPLELAELLLRDDPRWDREDLERAIADGRRRRIELRSPVPVHLLYWTAVATDGGPVRFYADRYGFDRLQHATQVSDEPESEAAAAAPGRV